jgi:hypothetical protein
MATTLSARSGEALVVTVIRPADGICTDAVGTTSMPASSSRRLTPVLAPLPNTPSGSSSDVTTLTCTRVCAS